VGSSSAGIASITRREKVAAASLTTVVATSTMMTRRWRHAEEDAQRGLSMVLLAGVTWSSRDHRIHCRSVIRLIYDGNCRTAVWGSLIESQLSSSTRTRRRSTGRSATVCGLRREPPCCNRSIIGYGQHPSHIRSPPGDGLLIDTFEQGSTGREKRIQEAVNARRNEISTATLRVHRG